jgi:putative heme-binding domain-containing protein
MAPGGWIARFRPDGSQWEMVGIGFRNQYDIAFNDRGDLFAYDADMEWDMGLPWYRPTRIAHVVPGLEFGWRNGTGKWPDYYEDSMPSVIDIGPGSPTGFLSGKGAAFPERYQRALFALDWTFGTISALHLKQDGASYTAEREEFVAGPGLPLTDGVIGKDGAMYFASGGRRTASFLWRVTYAGNDAAAPVAYGSKELELMAPAEARKALGSSDRALRFQARAALEAAGAEAAGKAGGFSAPWAVINRVILGARINGTSERAGLLKALDGLDWASLTGEQKLAWLRAAGLVFIRTGAPEAAEKQGVLAKIDAAYPSNDATLNAELCRMLSYLDAPGVVGRTLALMDAAGPSPAPDWLALAERNRGYGGAIKRMLEDMPSSQVVHYVNCLRCVPGPWDRNERERFFTWLARLEGEKGGNSFVGYIKDFRKEALAIATEEEREWLAQHAPTKVANPFADLPPVKGPGHIWTIDEVVSLASQGLEERDKEAGRTMFKAALCAACHRFAGEGGAAGPDLTAVAGRFTVKDLAEAIIEPGKVVSDQYAFEIIKKNDGTQVVGRTVDQKDEKLVVAVNPFDFNQTVEVVLSDVESTMPSPISPMPAGMINRLNKEELKDLLAYLLSK